MPPPRRHGLGPLEPVEPADVDGRGDPVLGPDQVYVTRGGRVFHPMRCEIVDQLLVDARPVLVVRSDGVGERRECRVCVVQSSLEWKA